MRLANLRKIRRLPARRHPPIQRGGGLRRVQAQWNTKPRRNAPYGLTSTPTRVRYDGAAPARRHDFICYNKKTRASHQL